MNAKNANSVLSALSSERQNHRSAVFYISNATYGFLLVLPALAIMLAVFIYPMMIFGVHQLPRF